MEDASDTPEDPDSVDVMLLLGENSGLSVINIQAMTVSRLNQLFSNML